jgi:putative hydrolase of the HAD superfamily
VIRAVTFDAAGTLIAPREPVGVTYARVARAHGVAAEPAAIEARFRRTFRAAPPLAFAETRGPALRGRERDWWRAVVRATLDSPDDARLDACFEALYAHYAGAAAWTVFPDVEPALQDLRGRGLRVGVVSNFDGRLPALLDGLGLAASLDVTVWSSAAGTAKPAAEIFDAAARGLGVIRADILHVGDDPTVDVDGARAAGLSAVLLDRGRPRREAIASLHRLAGRLDDLTRRRR